MLIATAAEMRELDRTTIEDVGIPGVVLMENAGAGVARAVATSGGERVGVVCGVGNNGGDGFVIARHLWNRGVDVRVYLVAVRDKIRGDAKINLDAAERCGVPFVTSLDGLKSETVVVDALLGTGLKDDVRGALGDAIDRINALPKKITRSAVDIPSGLDADTGMPHGRAVRADLTYTMGLPKVGLVSAPGFEAVGELHVVDIGLPRGLAEKKGLATWLLEDADVARRVPPRPKSGHKGTFGHLLVVAGSHGKTGAALLAGEAALRGGAGLVTLAVRPDVQKVLEGRVRELMTGAYTDESQLRALAKGKRAVALGPGIPTDDAMRDLVRRWARELPLPMVIDADGLNLLAGATDVLRGAAGPRLLTPHPGEMARLCDTTTEAVQSDRVAVARKLAAHTGAFVALKGARTVVAAPDGRAFINPTGNPGMGTGGTGDVLTGLCGSLLAQGLEPLDALLVGVYCHGRAGDRAAARKKSQRGLLARDLIAEIPAALTF